MKLFAAVGLISLAFSHEFAVCKSHHDYLGVNSVEFKPDPPVSGSELLVSVKGKSAVDIADGDVHVDVRVLGITVESQILDLCGLVPCPLNAGDEFHADVSQLIPEGIPSHSGATVRLTLVRKDGTPLSCLETFVQVASKQPVVDTPVLGAEEPHHEVPKFIDSEIEFLFKKWQKMFPHAKHDLKVFSDNLRKIFEHNQKKLTFTMAMNEFGSMTEDEFFNTHFGIRKPKDVPRKGPMKPATKVLRTDVARADPPAELDWTTRGVVTPVENQGSCGSCWAFSAVGSLESAYAIKTGNLVEFSEQELVSCDVNDYGCQGGLMDSAFDWIEHSSGGLCTEQDYGYTSGSTSYQGSCLKSTCTPVADSVPKGYIDIDPNEPALLAGLVEHGPVSVAIEADQAVFQFYHSGVLTGACGRQLDHGVLLVGYGVDAASGTPFWKVKNSWGAGWGEAGYVRIQRGKRYPPGGECGIASKASFPVL